MSQESPFIELQGTKNFRDAGGHLTAQGRRVRRGLLFRSNRLNALTSEDRARLAPLGVTDLFDLRAQYERDHAPTFWPGPRLWTWPDGPGPKGWAAQLADYPPTAEGSTAFMLTLYRSLPAMLAPKLAAIARTLASRKGACVVYCSAGKDRTGVATAILLSLLDVPIPTILSEYELSDGRFGLDADQLAALAAPQDRELRPSRNSEAAAVLVSAKRPFLEAAMAEIEAVHGTVDAYARRAMQLDDMQLTRFRAALLES